MSTATSQWVTKASNKEGGNFELPPIGTHGAVCIGIIDLGTQTDTYQGESKTQRKLYICWELTRKKNKEGNNFIVAQEYTWSLGKKAALRGVVEGWTGRQLGDNEEFDWTSLIGRSCLVSLVDKNGYPKVGSIGIPMDGFEIPPATTPPIMYHTSESSTTDLEPPIPDWVPYTYGMPIKEKIMNSPEWKGRSPF